MGEKGSVFFRSLNAGVDYLAYACILGGVDDIAVLFYTRLGGIHPRNEQKNIYRSERFL